MLNMNRVKTDLNKIQHCSLSVRGSQSEVHRLKAEELQQLVSDRGSGKAGLF